MAMVFAAPDRECYVLGPARGSTERSSGNGKGSVIIFGEIGDFDGVFNGVFSRLIRHFLISLHCWPLILQICWMLLENEQASLIFLCDKSLAAQFWLFFAGQYFPHFMPY
jgi:hypothetical protein